MFEIPGYDGSNLQILIVHIKSNKEVIYSLLYAAEQTLIKNKVNPQNIYVEQVGQVSDLLSTCERLIKWYKECNK